MFFAVLSSSSPPVRPRTAEDGFLSSSSSSSFSLLSRSSTICALNPWKSCTRRILLSSSSFLLSSFLSTSLLPSTAGEIEDELQQDEDRTVRIFRETSPSVVFIKDFSILSNKNKGKPSLNPVSLNEEDEDDADVQIEGVGSGFVWDSSGHIVTNYHVIEKLVTDQSGRQRCKIFLQDSSGKTFSKEGKIIGFDPSHDLAVLKVDVKGAELRPVIVGSSTGLRVGQSCYAIGNPLGYDHTLTSGIVSGLGREIPSPNGRPIRGAIQTDADINSGNSGGPLIDSHGHVIGVNTATFTRRGTGMSSGVNFAIPIDLVVQTVPYLIVNGTATSNRF